MSRPAWGVHRAGWAVVSTATLLAGMLAVSPPARAEPPEPAGSVAAEVLAELAANGSADFFVILHERADLSPAAGLAGSKAARGAFVHRALRASAARSQAGLVALLEDRGAEYQPFWISNRIWVHGDRALLDELAGRPEVSGIEADTPVPLVEPVATSGDPVLTAVKPTTDPPTKYSWGVLNIGADEVWHQFDTRGEGIVVGVIDNGPAVRHPALMTQYRGYLGNGERDHRYNYSDPMSTGRHGFEGILGDHATHVTGTVLGDDGAGNRIGVAPGAQWIAARACGIVCPRQTLLAAGEWMLAPYLELGAQPRPDLAPDIVNNSWGGPGGDPFYQDIVDAWVAAGIFPVFAVGNDGPACRSAAAPSDYLNSYAVGAYQRDSFDNRIASFSSRGFSRTDGSELKPDLAAPGTNIRSATIPTGGVFSYQAKSGTSMAAPHVAGTVALLWSAAPELRGDIPATREVLDQTAGSVKDQKRDGTVFDPLRCGGNYKDNNVFGKGRLDAFAAVDLVRDPVNGVLTGRILDATTGWAIFGATVTIEPGGHKTVTGDPGGVFRIGLEPGTYQLTAGVNRYAGATSAPFEVEVGEVTTVDLALEPDHGTLVGQMTDAATGEQVGQGVPFTIQPGDLSLQTGVAGGYEVELSEGSYQVTVDINPYQTLTAPLEIEEGVETELDLALEPNSGILTGRITGTSAATATITAEPLDYPGRPEVEGDAHAGEPGEGRYRLELSEGTYRVTASAGLRFPQTIEEVEIEAGHVTELDDFALATSSGLVSGTVTAPDGSAVQADVTLAHRRPWCPGCTPITIRTDLSDFLTGEYRMSGPAGVYDVIVEPRSRSYQPTIATDVELVAGEEVTRNFVVEPTAGPSTHRAQLVIIA